MIGNDSFQPGRHHLSDRQPLFHDLRGRQPARVRVRPPEVENGLLFGGGHAVQQHLEIIDFRQAHAEMLGQAVTDGGFAGAGRPP